MYGPKQGSLGNRQRPRASGARAAVLGSGPRAVPPAWRGQQSRSGPAPIPSKILISNFPLDVEPNAVRELFSTTVGPIRSSTMLYNKTGRSLGMVIVNFQHPANAVRAKAMYEGKIVDGSQPLTIELVGELSTASVFVPTTFDPLPQPAPPKPRTLLDRVGGDTNQHTIIVDLDAMQRRNARTIQAQANTHIPADQQVRRKKGPRRIQKSNRRAIPRKVTVADLDREMDEYKAAAPVIMKVAS